MKCHCGSIHAHDDHESARLEHKVIKILVPFTAAAGLLLGYVSSRLLPVTWRGNLWRTLLQIAIHFYVSRGKTTPICRSRDQMAWCMESICMMKAYQVTAIKRNCRETVPTIAYPARQRSCHDQWRVAVAALALRLRQRRCCDSEHSQDMLLRSLVILPSFGSTANSCWMDQQKWKVSCTLLVGAGDIQF